MRDIASLVALRGRIGEDEARSLLHGRREWNADLAGASVTRVERRAAGDAAPKADAGAHLRISGFSAVFDSDSELLCGFISEQIKRGAFRKVLRTEPDVRLLANHEGLPYARTTNGTLTLSEKPDGLWMEAQLDERDSDALSLAAKIERGDVDQQSFAFTVAADEWRMCDCVDSEDYAGCDCVWERDIKQIGDLFEVSVVTFPAYPATTVQTDSVARNCEQGREEVAQAIDGEQRNAPDSSSASESGASDHHATAIRLWLTANVMEVTHHESRTEGRAEACR